MEKTRAPLLFVGLGNPGAKYEATRHNMGCLVVEAFARIHGWGLREEKRFLGRSCKGKVGETPVHLLVPTTYMNESGRAVRKYVDYYKVKTENVWAVVDDTELPFGTMRLREKGSAGGHNGLKSLQTHLGTLEYPRLRVGIGQKRNQQELADYVLANFTQEELTALPEILKKGAQILKRLLKEEVARVMNDVNARPKQEKKKEENHEQTGEAKSV